MSGRELRGAGWREIRRGSLHAGLKAIPSRDRLLEIVCPNAGGPRGSVLVVVTRDRSTHMQSFLPDGSEPDEVRQVMCACPSQWHRIRRARVRALISDTPAGQRTRRVTLEAGDLL